MKPDYLCPNCRAILNVAGNVILSVKNQDGNYGLLLLHPVLGNYEVLHHHDFVLKDGEESNFCCPACHFALESENNNKLAEVIMRERNGQEFKIMFSRIKGEESTYKLQGESVEYFGKNYDNYLDYFNLSSMI